MKLKETEHEIMNAIINILWIKGFYPMRLNSGKIPMESKYGKRLIQLLPAGTPDIMAFKPYADHVKLIFVEVKAGNNEATWIQQQKMIELTRFGAKCIVAHSVDELLSQLT